MIAVITGAGLAYFFGMEVFTHITVMVGLGVLIVLEDQWTQRSKQHRG